MRLWTTGIAAATCAVAFAAAAQDVPRVPAPEGARAYFISPTDGETVHGAVTVRFGLAEMGVAPAGVPSPNTGHHHLLIDTPPPPFDGAIPNDERHRHFGGGQTEVRIELSPGRHTLQLLFADHNHVPHEPPVISEQISISVE